MRLLLLLLLGLLLLLLLGLLLPLLLLLLLAVIGTTSYKRLRKAALSSARHKTVDVRHLLRQPR